MPARLDLPDKEIVKLVDEGMSYSQVKEKLGLDCHVDTIARHYHQYKKKLKDASPAIEGEEIAVVTNIQPTQKDYATRRTVRVSWWRRLGNWFRRLLR